MNVLIQEDWTTSEHARGYGRVSELLLEKKTLPMLDWVQGWLTQTGQNGYGVVHAWLHTLSTDEQPTFQFSHWSERARDEVKWREIERCEWITIVGYSTASDILKVLNLRVERTLEKGIMFSYPHFDLSIVSLRNAIWERHRDSLQEEGTSRIAEKKIRMVHSTMQARWNACRSSHTLVIFVKNSVSGFHEYKSTIKLRIMNYAIAGHRVAY